MSSTSPDRRDPSNDEDLAPPPTLARDLARGLRVLRPDTWIARYLGLVGAVVLLERFLLVAPRHPALLLSAATGAALQYLLWLRAFLSVEAIPPFRHRLDGSSSSAIAWLARSVRTLGIPWLQLLAASALAAAVQISPSLWLDWTWEPGPMSLAAALEFRVSPRGSIAFEVFKDAGVISGFCALMLYIPARLRAWRMPQFEESPALSQRELWRLIAIVILLALPLFANAIAIALKIRAAPLYFVHVVGQTLGLVASLPGLLLLYRRWWARVAPAEWKGTQRPRSR